LHRDGGGQDGIEQIGVAFFDHDAALDARCKLADAPERQRIRHAELEKRSLVCHRLLLR